ncbi:MAG: ABC transporter permease [Anaerolineales bacterium]|nr:ABC transporter permease [Anaerolineales bacterium]MCX7609219.1 ABC transporter permease [Anaerolineales bacterium]
MKSFRLRMERRLEAPRAAQVRALAVSLFLALIVIGLLFALLGVNPFYAYQRILVGGFGSLYGLSETIAKAIPLALAGAGLSLAFRARVYNIGAEGQLLIGAIFGGVVALNFPEWPRLALMPTMFLAGFLGGALWASIPALLKARFRVDEVLTTLMMVYIASDVVRYLVYGPLRGPEERGFPYSSRFSATAQLPHIDITRIHYPTLILAILAAILLYLLLERTKLGYEIRVAGENPAAARYAGMDTQKIIVIVLLISGGLAGMAGVGEVAGIHARLSPPEGISPGYGFTAIIVAWLARLNPLATLLTAFLIGGLLVGGDAIQVALNLPAATIQVFNGVILLFVIAGDIFTRYRIRLEKQA